MLVPGATGRTDVAHDERRAVVAELRSALAAAHTRASRTTGRTGVRVVVVAPAPVSGVRTTDDGVPDLGAHGLERGALPGDVQLRQVRDGTVEELDVMLHTAASVVTVLLRRAGWNGPIRSVEVGGSPGEPGAGRTAPQPIDADMLLSSDDGAHRFLVFTTVSGLPEEPSGRAVPSGISDLLRRADRTVSEVYRSVCASTTTG